MPLRKVDTIEDLEASAKIDEAGRKLFGSGFAAIRLPGTPNGVACRHIVLADGSEQLLYSINDGRRMRLCTREHAKALLDHVRALP